MAVGIGSPEEVEALEIPSTDEIPQIRFMENVHKKLRLLEIRIEKLEAKE